MAFRIRIEMTTDRRAEVKAAVKELVDMRNGLVHHLIERFDLWTDDGCVAAIDHLNSCYDQGNAQGLGVALSASTLSDCGRRPTFPCLPPICGW